MSLIVIRTRLERRRRRLAIVGAAAVVAVTLVLRTLRLRPARWHAPHGVLTVLAPRAAPARAGPCTCA